MRLIDGVDVATMLSRYGPLSPPRAVAIVRQIGSALDAAHAAGVLHREVKPENILVSADEFAYLVDLGIASASSDES
jgi:serine/threonine-protein kinase